MVGFSLLHYYFSWYLCFRKLQWLLYLHKQCFLPFVGNFVVNGNWLVLHITGVEEDSMYPNEFCHFFCKLSLFICLANSPSLSVSIFTAELFCDRTEVHKYIVCITGKRFLILSLWKALGLRRLVTVVLALLSQKTLLWMESFQMHISILLGLLIIYPNTATLKLIFFLKLISVEVDDQ